MDPIYFAQKRYIGSIFFCIFIPSSCVRSAHIFKKGVYANDEEKTGS